LLEASMGHGGAELLCKYTFILGRSEGEELAVNGGGSWPRFTAQQGRSTTVLQARCISSERSCLRKLASSDSQNLEEIVLSPFC